MNFGQRYVKDNFAFLTVMLYFHLVLLEHQLYNPTHDNIIELYLSWPEQYFTIIDELILGFFLYFIACIPVFASTIPIHTKTNPTIKSEHAHPRSLVSTIIP